MFFPECLDLHIHTRRQIELHQRIHRLLRRLKNVKQPLVGADFELLPAISYPHAANAARSICSSSWAAESAPQSVLPCAAPSPQSRRSTDPECDSRKPSAGCEFFLFQSRFTLSNPSRHLRKERTGGKPQAALYFYVGTAALGCPRSKAPRFFFLTAQSPQSFPRPPCVRLRESQSASLSPSPPA